MDTKNISRAIREEDDQKTIDRVSRSLEYMAVCKPHLMPVAEALIGAHTTRIAAEKAAREAMDASIAAALEAANSAAAPAPDAGDEVDPSQDEEE